MPATMTEPVTMSEPAALIELGTWIELATFSTVQVRAMQIPLIQYLFGGRCTLGVFLR